MTGIQVGFLADGRPALVASGTAELTELADVLDALDRRATYQGGLASPAIAAFVPAARHVVALAALVPDREPKDADQRPRARRWMTTVEAAELLGISKRAVIKRINAGHLVAELRGGRYLIDMTQGEARAAS